MCRQLVQFVIMHMQSYVLLEFLDFAIITFKIKGALLFFPKLRVLIKENNNAPHGKFHRFLFPFSSKFPYLNFAPYVLHI